MKLIIFYVSYIYVPFLVICLLVILRRRGPQRALAAIAIGISSLLAYARFIEPRILNVERVEIVLEGANETSQTVRIALFSDTHFGVYRNAMPMDRIVDRLTKETPDAVFIAGDFLYHLSPGDIPEALAPLEWLEAPIYAVLGNHDVGFPGPIYSAELYAALENLGVTLVENRAIETTIGGQEIVIGGTSDLWQRQQNFAFTSTLPDKPLILLTHNPDTALSVPDDIPFSIMLAGHTHGGQIRLPGMVNRVIPTQYPFDKGLHRVATNGGQRLVYVTSGTGMVGLPMRFAMPPRIDVLTFRLPPPNSLSAPNESPS